jgi:hypothetical protein
VVLLAGRLNLHVPGMAWRPGHWHLVGNAGDGSTRPHYPSVGATHAQNGAFFLFPSPGRADPQVVRSCPPSVLADQEQYAMPAPPPRQPTKGTVFANKDRRERRLRYTVCGLTRSMVPELSSVCVCSYTRPATPIAHALTIWTNHDRTNAHALQACAAPQRPDAADPHPRRGQFDTRPTQQPQRHHTTRPHAHDRPTKPTPATSPMRIVAPM